MRNDNWKNYKEFKVSKPDVEAYYSLVKSAFITGVQQVCPNAKVDRAIDLGCGSGELSLALLEYANHITGVDSSPTLIKQAQQGSNPQNSTFIEADVLDANLLSLVTRNSFDLVTAAWLHNHLLHKEEQYALLKTVLNLLQPKGVFVFLIPSSAFTSSRSQSFIDQLGWRQAWLEDSVHCSRGVYSFAGSEWTEMNVWQPMWLANVYMKEFSVQFVDVKTLSLKHRGMGENLIEPPFDVMIGKRL